jgi:hypothetical protein
MTMVTQPTTSVPPTLEPASSIDADGIEVTVDPEGFLVVRVPYVTGSNPPVLDEDRTREALAALARVGDLWAGGRRVVAAAKRADAVRDSLDGLLTPGLGELDPIPHATIEQCKRRALLRIDLLNRGAYTLASLADGRGQSMAAIRQWVHRARQRSQVFTVKHDGETLVPAFLLDPDLDPRPEYTEAIRILTGIGSEGWGLWSWFVYPLSWLGNRVAAEHALVDPDDVIRAAQDEAASLS